METVGGLENLNQLKKELEEKETQDDLQKKLGTTKNILDLKEGEISEKPLSTNLDEKKEKLEKQKKWREENKKRKNKEKKEENEKKFTAGSVITNKEGKIYKKLKKDYPMISTEDLDESQFEKTHSVSVDKNEKTPEYEPSEKYTIHRKKSFSDKRADIESSIEKNNKEIFDTLSEKEPQPKTRTSESEVGSIVEKITDGKPLNKREATIHHDYIGKIDRRVTSVNKQKNEARAILEKQKVLFEEKIEKSNFSKENFKDIDIETLSFEKRMLLVETLEQQLLDKVKRGAKEAFEEDLKKSGKLGRIWKNVRKGYNIAKKEQEVLQKHKDGESLISQETAKALAETVSSITAPITYKEGRTEISYMEEKDASGVENSFAKEFNTAANIFSKIPSEWQFSHNKKEQAQYRQSKEVFDTACSEIIAQAPEASQGELMEKVQHATGNVTLLQHLMTHPEAGAVLARAGKTKAWQTGIESYYKENASFMALGMASRQAIMGTSIELVSHSAAIASALAAPITGGIIGGLRAKDRAKKSLAERDADARRGVSKDNRKHLQKNMINVQEIDNMFDYLVTKIETTTDPEKKKRFIASLKTRTEFIEKELSNGTIQFGSANESQGDRDADRIRRYMSFTKRIIDTKVLLKVVDEGDTDVQSMKNFVRSVTENEEKNKTIRKKEVEDEIIKGVLIGAGFGAAGWLVRHMLPDVDLGISEKVGELYRNAKSGVQDFFGEQGIKTPRADIEIKNTPTAQDNTERLQRVPIDESTEYKKVPESKPKILDTREENGATINKYEYPKKIDPRIIENLQKGGENISSESHETLQEKLSVIGKEGGENLSVIGKGIPTTEVTVSSKGFIKTIEELQKTFLKEHPTEKLPDSLKGNPTEIAQKLGLYNPEGSKSGMVIGNKETTLGINEQGDIVLHDATKNTETILSAKNTFKGSFIETGKVNIPAQENVQTDYTESAHSENTKMYTENERDIYVETPNTNHDVVSFFKKELLDKNQVSLLSEKYVGELQGSHPQLWDQIQALGDETTIHSDPDEKALSYIQRAMKKIEGMESSGAEHIETSPSQETTFEEDTHSEEVEGDVSLEEATPKTPTQTPEQVLDEPLDAPKTRGVMSPEQVSQMVEARARGDVNGTLDGIFGQKRNFLFDRNVIEGSGARNPAWTKVANMKAYEFFSDPNLRVSRENQVLLNTFKELHSQTGNPVPRQGETVTVEQYLKKEYETLAQQEYKKTGTLMKK